jgi:hypothetical protein
MTVAVATSLTPNPASGNLTADGTEQTLASGTSAGTYQLHINLSNMASGDAVRLRIYSKANSLDTETVVYDRTFANVQGEPLTVSPPHGAVADYKATLQQTAGTNRTYQWAVVAF